MNKDNLSNVKSKNVLFTGIFLHKNVHHGYVKKTAFSDKCPEMIYVGSSYSSKVMNFSIVIKELDVGLRAVFETN